MKNKDTTKKIVNFLFEATALKRLKRTGWQILGDNEESIAEHSYMVCVISYSLAVLIGAKIEKTLLLALFHDFSETRTGDVYKLADLYLDVKEDNASTDAFDNLPDSGKIIGMLRDYQKKESIESKIVKDADTLALVIELKQLVEKGSENATEWLDANLDRLRLSESKKFGEAIKKGNSQDWWQKEREIIHKGYKIKR